MLKEILRQMKIESYLNLFVLDLNVSCGPDLIRQISSSSIVEEDALDKWFGEYRLHMEVKKFYEILSLKVSSHRKI